jgi:O-acetyl-ADP-ribose deacetylase (regulator of RNase III)
MIREVCGDILLSNAHLVAHGVAPNDDFKSGLALALRQKFPALYKDFRHWCRMRSPRPGEAWVWSGVGEAGRTVHVACLLTQEPAEHEGSHPGRAKSSYVNKALHALRKIVEHERFTSVALPRLATGVGGLAWEEVRPLVVASLDTLDVPVLVYTTFKKDVAADEGLAVRAKGSTARS